MITDVEDVLSWADFHIRMYKGVLSRTVDVTIRIDTSARISELGMLKSSLVSYNVLVGVASLFKQRTAAYKAQLLQKSDPADRIDMVGRISELEALSNSLTYTCGTLKDVLFWFDHRINTYTAELSKAFDSAERIDLAGHISELQELKKIIRGMSSPLKDIVSYLESRIATLEAGLASTSDLTTHIDLAGRVSELHMLMKDLS